MTDLVLAATKEAQATDAGQVCEFVTKILVDGFGDQWGQEVARLSTSEDMSVIVIRSDKWLPSTARYLLTLKLPADANAAFKLFRCEVTSLTYFLEELDTEQARAIWNYCKPWDRTTQTLNVVCVDSKALPLRYHAFHAQHKSKQPS